MSVSQRRYCFIVLSVSIREHAGCVLEISQLEKGSTLHGIQLVLLSIKIKTTKIGLKC